MTPYEIMLSESQERMLIIVKKGHEQTVVDIFEKWDLPYAEVGVVKDDGMMRVLNHGEVVAEIPARQLADDAPLYEREAKPQPPRLRRSISPRSPKSDYHAALSRPARASEHRLEELGLSPIRSHGARRHDGAARLATPRFSSSARRTKSSPRRATATRSTARSIRARARASPSPKPRAISPAAARRPLAVTDNLNFGNPHNPENFWQLRECVEGLAEGCRAFDTPVTGGNVSLYNQSPAGAIDPTPTVGMVGLIEDEKHVTTSHFKNAGDVIICSSANSATNSAPRIFSKCVHGQKIGRVRRVSTSQKRSRVHDAVRALIKSRLVKSAHDCSEGGLAVALAESCISGGEHRLGATVSLDGSVSADVGLFNESQSRIVISVAATNAASVISLCEWRGVPARRLGTVGGNDLQINVANGELHWPITTLHAAWWNSIALAMK